MPNEFLTIVQGLERLAAYDGPWRPLRDETGLLRERIRELREREARLDDLLVVALVGGSGVGKSTLLNAIAGDQLAKTSEFRPCTSVPALYYPPGAEIQFRADGWSRISGSALEKLVIIDTPDSDTIVREHRQSVQEALLQSDLIVMCGSPEKYLDEATWSLLRPLQGERTMVCVETKAREGVPSVREHWLGRLNEQGFRVADYFRLNALHTLDRKLAGRERPEAEEYDWDRFETFLQHELTNERILRIKRSNTVGLLRKTFARLRANVAAREPELQALAKRLDELDQAVSQGGYDILVRRIFAEPHLWAYAQAREVSARAKGIVGGTYRLLEGVRNLPLRLREWMPRPASEGGAARLLMHRDVFIEEATLHLPEVSSLYERKRSELALEFARAGFDSIGEGGVGEFDALLHARAAEVLRGPARDRLVRRARLLTSWPVTLLTDLPPLGFLAYTAYILIEEYLTRVVPPGMAVVQALLVFGILLGSELLGLSVATRISAWSARKGARRDLRLALDTRGAAFHPERAALSQAEALAREIGQLESAVARVTQG